MDVGTDIDCITDIAATPVITSGTRNLGNALARRLLTPPGALYYDLTYGVGLHRWLNASWIRNGIASLGAIIERELERDERVLRVRAQVTYTDNNNTLSVSCIVTTANGTFRFVMSVNNVTPATWTMT